MTEYNNQNVESENLMDEFEKLIFDVSQDIIDQTIMADLKVLKTDLSDKMIVFSEQASELSKLTSNISNLLSQSTINMNTAITTTVDGMNEFLENTTHMMDSKFTDRIETLDEQIKQSDLTFDEKSKLMIVTLESLLEDKSTGLNQLFVTVKDDLNRILVGSTEGLDEKFSHVTQELNQTMVSASSLLDEKFEGVSTGINDMLKNTTGIIHETVSTTTNEISDILEQTKAEIGTSITSVGSDLKQVLESNVSQMDGVLSKSSLSMDKMVQAAKVNFEEEVKRIHDYLSNAEKLIRNNQKVITDAQRSIEERLNESLVQIVDESNKNKINSAYAVEMMESQVEKVTKDVYRLHELNNTINIKVDHSIKKAKEHQKKNNLKFILLAGLNSVTLLAAIITLIFSLRG